MKTKNYYLLIAMLFITAMALGREHSKATPGGRHALTPKKGKTRPATFLQDIRMYNISGQNQVVMSFIPEPLASKTGYMGFKTGDRVKWAALTPVGQTSPARYFTGTITMLDSDKCYIMIDHSNRVAVKPFEDIIKLKP